MPRLWWYGVHVKPSSIQHSDTFLELFFTEHFAGGATIEYKFKILVRSDEVTLFGRNETYGERVTVGAINCFKRYAIQLSVEIASSHGDDHNFWIFLAKFCYLRFISDSRYLDCEKPAWTDIEG